MEHRGRKKETRASDSEFGGDRGVCSSEAPSAVQAVARSIRYQSESAFLSAIRTAINRYYRKIDTLPSRDEEAALDVGVQRDLARECVLDVDNLVNSWKVWKGRQA